jgi:hypothetical protein
MSRIVGLALCLALALSSPGPAFAQKRACPEGRTLSGECVNPALANSMRQRTIVFSQPKLSYRGPAVLPSEEFKFAPLRDRRIIYELFGPGGCPPAC